MIRLICLCLMLPFVALAKNSFLVAPGIVEFDIKKPKTQTFILTNNGDETIRLTIEPIYLPIDDHTLNMGKHLDPATQSLEDLTKSVRVSPKRLSLAPGQRRDIRISIRPDANLPEGDYRTHLLVKMMEFSEVIRNQAGGQNTGVGMNLNVKMETAVAIYGSKGTADPQLQFLCHKTPESDKLTIKVINPTSWRFDGPVRLSEGNNVIFDRRFVSLRNSEKDREFEHTYSADEKYQVSYSSYKRPEQTYSASCQHI